MKLATDCRSKERSSGRPRKIKGASQERTCRPEKRVCITSPEETL